MSVVWSVSFKIVCPAPLNHSFKCFCSLQDSSYMPYWMWDFLNSRVSHKIQIQYDAARPCLLSPTLLFNTISSLQGDFISCVYLYVSSINTFIFMNSGFCLHSFYVVLLLNTTLTGVTISLNPLKLISVN